MERSIRENIVETYYVLEEATDLTCWAHAKMGDRKQSFYFSVQRARADNLPDSSDGLTPDDFTGWVPGYILVWNTVGTIESCSGGLSKLDARKKVVEILDGILGTPHISKHTGGVRNEGTSESTINTAKRKRAREALNIDDFTL